jgi:hypothetical protein
MTDKKTMEIRLGATGRITRGEEAGRFVQVIDDSENTGGFLILTSADSEGNVEAFDNWVESIVDVERYGEESAWEIDWDIRR